MLRKGGTADRWRAADAPSAATDAMKRSKSLVLTATNPNADDPAVFMAVSLEGFATAMNKVAELAK